MIDAECLLFLALLFALIPAAGSMHRLRQPVFVLRGKTADRRLSPDIRKRGR